MGPLVNSAPCTRAEVAVRAAAAQEKNSGLFFFFLPVKMPTSTLSPSPLAHTHTHIYSLTSHITLYNTRSSSSCPFFFFFKLPPSRPLAPSPFDMASHRDRSDGRLLAGEQSRATLCQVRRRSLRRGIMYTCCFVFNAMMQLQ